jgi:hypothetical protein
MTTPGQWLVDYAGDAIESILTAPARLQAEHDLRLAAEKRAQVAEARVAELEAELAQWQEKAGFYYAAFGDEAAKGMATR